MAAKKSRERKISKLKELKIQRDRLMKEDRELENLLQEYATRKRFLEQKFKSLQGKVERARLRYTYVSQKWAINETYFFVCSEF